MKVFLTIFFLLNLSFLHSQVEDEGKYVRGIILGTDTIPYMALPSVSIGTGDVFVSKRETAKYKRLKRDVKKAYPYAKLTGEKLRKYEAILEAEESKRDRKKIMKKVEKELKEEYGEELRNLTVTQGKILLKLIDRETGSISYDLVKELRGTFSAVFWQTMARVVGSNLKVHYDPTGEDKEIEKVVQLIENGLL